MSLLRPLVAECAQVLAKAGVAVDATRRGRAHGDPRAGADEGRCQIYTEGFQAGRTVTLSVVCMVTPGHDIEGLVDRVWEALRNTKDRFSPTSVAFARNSTPPTSADGAKAADWAEVEVVSNTKLPVRPNR